MRVSWTNALLIAGSALVGAVVLIVVVAVVVRLVARRWHHATRLARWARTPFRAFVLVLAAGSWISAVRTHGAAGTTAERWWDAATHAGRLLGIGTGAWLLAAVLVFLEDLALVRTNVEDRDNRVARRVRTQMLVVKRLTIAAVTVVAIGAMLLSFPTVKAIGTSVLASAGVISVVAALAAQSTLANLFAGVQLAFNDAIKIDDVVIVEEEWGWIEEITLSYVVVRLWDDRRMIVPSTYFTSTPFQNWTRRTSELIGAVELDLDWCVDLERLKAELTPIMEDARSVGLWDGRVSHVQVTDAVDALVRVRVLVSAVDAGTLFDLRCLVRERLVAWLRDHDEAALPRRRVSVDRAGEQSPTTVRP